MTLHKGLWFSWLIKPLIFMAALSPFLLLVLNGINDDLGADPVETVTFTTGDWALRMLLLTLAMMPLKQLINMSWPIKLRRMFGLYVFFYASLHFLTWAWLDQQLFFEDIVADIIKRPYVTVGFTAWLLLLPLAITSNRWSIRKLGRQWSQLHKLIYPIAVLVILHFIWLVKADLLEPLIYAAVLFLLLLIRWRKDSGFFRVSFSKQ